jgi:uncharacterized protein YjbJ (UPF0337 family)
LQKRPSWREFLQCQVLHKSPSICFCCADPLARALLLRAGVKAAFALDRAITGDVHMNWDQVEGNWKQFKGKVQQQWGKLTDDHLDIIAGNRKELAGKVQEAYGITKEEAEKQIKTFEARYGDWMPDDIVPPPVDDLRGRQTPTYKA